MGKRAKRSKRKPSIQSGRSFNKDEARRQNLAPNSNGQNQTSESKDAIGLRIFFETIGVGICGILSNNFFSTDHKVLGVVFSFGAVASFFAILATAFSRKYAPRKIWSAYSIVVLLIAIVFVSWGMNLSKKKSEPTLSDIGRGITNLEAIAASQDSREREMQAYFSNQWRLSQLQLSQAQNALTEAQEALKPRRITLEQREKFLKILLDHNNISKMPIQVIVGKTDSETENFALQFREMLDAAGYGSEIHSAPDAAYSENKIMVTSLDPNVPVPPIDNTAKIQEILRLPDFFVSPTKHNQKDVDVIAIFSSTNGEISIPSLGPDPASLMVFYPNPKVIHDTNDIHYAYHPTTNANQILLGVCNALINCQISTGPLQGKSMLQPGQIAFFIPQKTY